MSRHEAHRERGAVALLVAVSAMAMFVLAALVVDLGLARDVRRQSQNAADASALAGANTLYPTSGICSNGTTRSPCLADAVAAVKSYAASNFQVSTAQWSSCTDPARPAGYYVLPAGNSPCISFDSQTATTKVWVRMPTRTVETALGGVAGVEEIPVASVARATLEVTVGGFCALCFLGPVDAGNADFSVQGGDIQVNGSLQANPNSYWTALNQIGVSGTVSGPNQDKFSPDWVTTAPIPDPFESMTLPVATPWLVNRTNPCTQGPGVYGTFELPNNQTCTLTAGVYVVNGTWSMKNNSVLTGTGVTLYVKRPGLLDFKNGNVNNLLGPVGVPSGAPPTWPAGFVILYDRDNTNVLTIQGNGNVQLGGVVYAPKSKIDFNGNSCLIVDKGAVIALGTIKANGNKACITLTNASNRGNAPQSSGLNLDR